MYISQIRLKSEMKSGSRFWSLFDYGYEIHQLVWNLFSDNPDRERDFLFRAERRGDGIQFITVSERPPNDGKRLWEIQTKPYEPKLRKGDRLAFSLRANPVQTKTPPGGKRIRHDIVMEAKTRLKEQGVPRPEWPTVGELAQRQGTAWLATRAPKWGATVTEDAVRIDGYHQHRYRKGKRDIRISTMEFSGVLTVEDPDSFTQTLYSGVGPAKGFGCGLMLVRRV